MLIKRSELYQPTGADKVRQYVVKEYIRPAQVRGERIVSVTAGDVHKALGLKNRIALVCTALRATRFQSENHLRLKDVSGPPSGMSTSVKFTFEIVPGVTGSDVAEANPLWQLRGIAKDMFEKVGEWEDLIRKEREQLCDLQDKMSR
jgi:hypothetical protein